MKCPEKCLKMSLYLVAFSRTVRVRKPIHMPSLFPKIHSKIPVETRKEGKMLFCYVEK